MKSCILITLLFLALGCEAIAPQTTPDNIIYHLDNSSEFGLGGFNDGYNFTSRTISDKPDLIVSPYTNTDGDVLGVMLYDQTNNLDYKLDFRFKESHNEAVHYYENFEFLRGITEQQKIFKYIPRNILTSNSYRFDILDQVEYKAEKNDIWIFDDKIVIHVVATSFRDDGYVSLYFKWRSLNEN